MQLAFIPTSPSNAEELQICPKLHSQTCSDQHFYPQQNKEIDFKFNKLANDTVWGEIKMLAYLMVDYTPIKCKNGWILWMKFNCNKHKVV